MMLSPTTRASLLLRLCDPEDHETWVEFVELYEPVMYRLLRQRGLQDADARDALQELLLAVGRKVERCEAPMEQGCFREWLRRVARNLTINWMKRRGRQVWDRRCGLQSSLDELPLADDSHLIEFDREIQRAAFRHQEAAAMLAEDELDADLRSGDEWFSVDFTVQHLEPANDPRVLGRLGSYDVMGIIGHGRMGVVLKAFDPGLKRCVAVKVLSPHLAESSLARKRFAHEARAGAAVVHPNAMAIHHVQPGGRLPFLVMPLVAGGSLAERLKARGRLKLQETLRIGMQAAAALEAAHEQGLVHGDVKPANILLEKGVAILRDFGLARAVDDILMTRWGVTCCTPQYMPPEKVHGQPLDGRSDLFSLGCVLYEMATGVSPFKAESAMATLRRVLDASPPMMASLNPNLPPWFLGLIDRLLEKDPSRRLATAKEVSEMLAACLANLLQPTSVPLRHERTRSLIRVTPEFTCAEGELRSRQPSL